MKKVLITLKNETTFEYLNGEWSNIENLISNFYEGANYSVENEGDPGKTDCDLNAAVENDVETELIRSYELDRLIVEWLNTIKFNKVKMNDKYHYINFNYTNYIIAEKLFNIHGTIGTCIRFGHSRNDDVERKIPMYGNDEISWKNFYNSFNKDVKNNIIRLNEFIPNHEISELII